MEPGYSPIGQFCVNLDDDDQCSFSCGCVRVCCLHLMMKHLVFPAPPSSPPPLLVYNVCILGTRRGVPVIVAATSDDLAIPLFAGVLWLHVALIRKKRKTENKKKKRREREAIVRNEVECYRVLIFLKSGSSFGLLGAMSLLLGPINRWNFAGCIQSMPKTRIPGKTIRSVAYG